MQKKVASIAGTPIDTKMGADFLSGKDPALEVIQYNLSANPVEQTIWQYSSEENKHRRMTEVFDELEGKGVKNFFIYCNSLSGAFDFDAFSAERNVHIITPLQVYRSLANRYRCIAFNAANMPGAYGIDKVLNEVNPNLDVIGMGHLAIVRDIEAGYSPAEIIRRQGLIELARFFEAAGAQAWILGCTHFPYLLEELKQYTSLPIIDPAEEMYRALCENWLD